MKLNIRTLKTIVISPAHIPKYKQRLTCVLSQLTGAGFTNVHHFQSGTDTYPTCLIQAICDSLLDHLDEPFLLLEDDVQICHMYDTIECPDDTDAFYLGFSKGSAHPTENRLLGYAEVTILNESLIAIHNMLSGHAIAFLSRNYKERLLQELIEVIGEKHYNSDVVMGRLHKDFRIYGYYKPMFYQDALLGGAEEGTRFYFTSTLEMCPIDSSTV